MMIPHHHTSCLYRRRRRRPPTKATTVVVAVVPCGCGTQDSTMAVKLCPVVNVPSSGNPSCLDDNMATCFTTQNF
jgi:hypothetical protein